MAPDAQENGMKSSENIEEKAPIPLSEYANIKVGAKGQEALSRKNYGYWNRSSANRRQEPRARLFTSGRIDGSSILPRTRNKLLHKTAIQSI